MSQNHELRLNINAASAKRGAAEFKGAIASVKAAVRDLDRDTDGVFTSLRNVKLSVDTSAYKRAQNDAKALGTAAKQSADQRMKLELAAAAAMRTSQSQADRLYEKLSRLGDTQGITKLTLDLAKLQTRLAAASTPLDVRAARSQFADTASGINQTTRSLELQERAQNIAATSANSHAEALDRLRAKYNPLYAASQQYETALNEIAQAEQQGAISAQLAGDARTRAAQQLQSANGAMSKFGTTAKATSFQTANVTAQLQDVFITAQAGMSPLLIATQQGSQLALVMEQMAAQGGGAKGALTGLWGGVKSLVSPMSLVTVGGIAAVAMLAQWAASALGAEDAAETYEDRLKSLQGLQNELTSTTDLLKMSVQELTEKYGEAAIRVRELGTMQAQLKIAQVTGEMAQQSTILRASAREWINLSNGGHQYHELLQKLRSQFGFTRDQAIAFENALEQAATASSFDEQVAALRDLQRWMDAAGVSASELPPELAAGLDKMIALSNESDAARKLAADLAETVTNIAPGITPAVDEAARLKAELAAALALQNKINLQDSLEYSGRGQDPRKFMNGPQYTREMGYESPQDIIDQFNVKAARSNRKSSGGGRSKKLSDEARAIKKTTDAITSRHEALRAEARAMELVATGHFATIEAAQLYAEAELSGAKTTDKKTLAMLAQIDAAEALKEAQAGGFAQVQEDMQGTFKDALSGALQGDFDLSNIANGIRASIADAMAEQITAAIFPANNGATQAAQMQQALTSGGAAAAQQIRSAMTGGATAIQTAGMTSATSMATGVSTGSAAGASQMQAGIVAGSSQGAGMMARASGGGGLGGIFGGGNWMGMALGLGSALLSNRSSNSNSSPAFVEPVHSAKYYGADDVPSYAEGTANTSGIPATLHPNEAVIPLSRNRKVPVEMGGATGTGGALTFNVENHVTVEGSGGDEDATRIAESISVRMEAMIDEKLIDNMQYGGYMNQRGAF
ncbi:phage tail length tape measure family protein [Sulfitobacter sp.]|uniref:phage tail length tape measure family protein n=1 Tax=Sulfitobacter sp. TaxID=1903071 RepID=UPI003296C3CB